MKKRNPLAIISAPAIEISDYDIIEIFNIITKIDGDSLLEKMEIFCEENEIQEEVLGSYLAKSEQFKHVLWLDAVKNKQIHDREISDKMYATEKFDIW
jgi:hypothetical protein